MFNYEYDQWKTMSDIDQEEQDNKVYKEADDGLELLLEIIKGGDVNECL